ncbi:chromosome partitioning protein [Micromonospora sp. NPDC050980]|uniref:MinD/ParA family ATP-binding protein n=1 Tax=Micromonospora sp. NPDC050980 TaxID=3155161 RepID=UPI0033CE406C
MVHENDDRTPVPGRPQVPERDVEPLWPPEEIGGVVAAPPWAAPARPAVPPWPLPPADAPVPSPHAGPTTGAGHRPGTGDSPQPEVGLDLPFTLDRPTPVATPAVSGGMSGTFAPGPAPTAHGQVPGAATGDQPFRAGATGEDGPGDPVPATDGGEHPASGRPASPWAQPPQRATTDAAGSTGPVPAAAVGTPTHPHLPSQPTGSRADEVSAGPAVGPGPVGQGPVGQGPVGQGPVGTEAVGTGAVGTGAVDGPARGDGPHPAAEPGLPADGTPPRPGPFPPSPGVPIPQQPPYGTGAAHPPVAYPPQPGQAGQPGWYPPGWPQQSGTAQPVGPTQHHQPSHQNGPGQFPRAPAATPPPPPALPPGVYPEPGWMPQQAVPPTAEDFARRRQVRPVDPVATMGVRAVVNRMGLVRLAPGRHEQEMKRDIEMVRRNFGGLRQVTVVNPKGGAGKTVAILLLAMTFGQKRGGYVLAWDNNETQGTLGMRAQQDFHARTVRDMLRDLNQFQGAHGRVGDLSQYVRSQGEGMFDVLASDESATGGEMLTAAAFAEIRDVVSRFYKLIFVDTGNNVRAQNWQAAMDATDQLVVTMSARNDSAETAARMLDHLEQSGRQRLVRQAVTVVSMPPSRKEIDLPAIQAHFAARTRAVLLAPYERLIDTGEPLRYGQLSTATRDAWLKIAASVAEGL